ADCRWSLSSWRGAGVRTSMRRFGCPAPPTRRGTNLRRVRPPRRGSGADANGIEQLMARVYYGLAGDGHGHATRATTVIEHLLQDHEVIALTFGKASRLLRNRFASSQLELRE